MSDINMTKSEEEVCDKIKQDKLHTKEQLEAMGIDLSAEDNSIPSPSVNVLNVMQKQFDLEGYMKRHIRRGTAFSGADSFIYVNKKDMPIVQALKIDNFKTLDLNTNTITMSVTIPGGNNLELLNELLALEDGELLEIFCNELGDACYRKFTGLNFMYEDNYVDDSTIIATTLLTFSYKESTPYIKGLPIIK